MTRISDSKAQRFDDFTTAYAKHTATFFNLVMNDPKVAILPEPIDYKHLRNGECWCGVQDVLDEERRYWDETSKMSEEGYDELYDGGGDV